MIKFQCRKVDRRHYNIPVLSDAEIDMLAEMVIGDYKPTLLKEPGKIRFEHFLESYLGATIEFHDIYNEDPERPIFGATAFNDEELQIFDREHMCVSVVKVKPRTVVIDNAVMAKGKEGLALFTGLHEGGHLWMHEEVYTGSTIFDDNNALPAACCRQEGIEGFGVRRKIKTPKEWLEHQANQFASATAMPRATFIPVVRNIFKENGVYNRQIVIGTDEDLDYIAEVLAPEMITEIYGVSKKAAFVRLCKCGFVVNQQAYVQSGRSYA